MKAAGVAGIHFGPAVAREHRGEWFANTGLRTPQVYAPTLAEALEQLLVGGDETDLLV